MMTLHQTLLVGFIGMYFVNPHFDINWQLDAFYTINSNTNQTYDITFAYLILRS